MLFLLSFLLVVCISFDCPDAAKYGPGPSNSCEKVTDPLNKPKSQLESWFTREMFYDLFPKANLGYGASSPCNIEKFANSVFSKILTPCFINTDCFCGKKMR